MTRKKYVRAIEEKANQQKLDVRTLKECMDVALKDTRNEGLAVVPVACFLAKHGAADVWVITCAWESEQRIMEAEAKRTERTRVLGHICAWAIRAEDKEVLVYTACD